MLKRTSEEKQNPTEMDIREKINAISHSPVLQQEYLENLLKRIAIQPSIKIFASRILADVYARRGMWASAAKTMENAADASVSFNDRKNVCMEAGMLYIKAQDYLLADDLFRKAVDAASKDEKGRLQDEIKNLFFVEAESLDKQGKMSKSVKLYERLLRNAAASDEKKKIMMRLQPLYEKLSRVQDAIAMRESLKSM